MISEEDIAKFSFEEAPKIITGEVPGPNAKAIFDEALKYETPTRVSIRSPLVIDEARGATLKDADGNIFIDVIGGVAVSSVGRNNPRVVETVQRQSTKLMHSGCTVHPKAVELAKKLTGIMPGGMRNQCFTSVTQGGSDAVETVIKYARAITGKSQIIAFEGAYHGVWCGSLALTTNSAYRLGYGPLISGVVHMPYAYCYRCFANLKYPECGTACAKYFDYKINTPYTGADDVAAVIIEPIQGEGGYIDPPPEFLPMIKAACEKKGILYIDDEIQAGAGRTGKMWAIEHYDVIPDILIFGKGIGGDAPIAGVAVREELRSKLPAGSQPNTFEENALSCAVAITNIDLLTDTEMELVRRAAQLGEEVKEKLVKAAKDINIIGEVRGKGLMIGIELVQNQDTREPFANMANVIKKARDKGVIALPCGRYRNVLRLMPSLVISRSLFNKSVDILSGILKEEAKIAK